MSFRLRPQAETDIEAIALYIAADNPPAARRWLEDMLQRFRHLGEMPGMGVSRSHIRKDLRTLAAGSYLVLYVVADNGVEIIRVVHGARQWQDLL